MVWGSERVQASKALPCRWLTHITTTSPVRTPPSPPPLHCAIKSAAVLMNGGMRVGPPVLRVVALEVHLTTRQIPPRNGLPRQALRAMCSWSCWATMPRAKCSSPTELAGLGEAERTRKYPSRCRRGGCIQRQRCGLANAHQQRAARMAESAFGNPKRLI